MLAGNVGNLPIVLVQSICSNRQTPYAQLLPNGSCEEKGIAYVAFSMWIASTFQYCVAFNLLKKPKEQDLESKGSLSHNQMVQCPYFVECKSRLCHRSQVVIHLGKKSRREDANFDGMDAIFTCLRQTPAIFKHRSCCLLQWLSHERQLLGQSKEVHILLWQPNRHSEETD